MWFCLTHSSTSPLCKITDVLYLSVILFFNGGNEEDFRRTACTSLLQHVVETSGWGRERAEDEEPNVTNDASDGEGPSRDTQRWTTRTQPGLIPNLFLSAEPGRRSVGAGMIDMALRVCQQFLGVVEHSDIDVTVETPSAAEQQQWADFLQDYYMVVQ